MSISTQEVTTQCTNDSEGSEKAWKEKKKSWQNQKSNQEDFTPATKVNTSNTSKQSRDRPKKSDLADVTYYCCNKKGHYANKCTGAKKLAIISATCSLVTAASMEDNLRPLERVSCIHHLLYFQKDLRGTRALINLGSKVNAMTPTYAAKLGLGVQETDIGAQKIDGSIFNTFEIVLADFQVEDKLGRTRFFQETFLVANTTSEVILGMPFLTLSNVDVQFA